MPVKKKGTFSHRHIIHTVANTADNSASRHPSESQSRETSVVVDYSTWGFGNGGMTPIAMPAYGQAATNTICYPATASNPSDPASGSSTSYAQVNRFNYRQAATYTIAFAPPGSILGTPRSGSATPHAQYNASILPDPPSYNPRSTPEQLQAQLTQAITMLHERREQSASLQPIYPRMNFIVNTGFGVLWSRLRSAC